MDYRQIVIALSVAKHMSFSEAAWDTSVSLSSVSKQISALEAELGVRIFYRNAKAKVSLTREGEIIIPRLQEMQYIYEKLQLDINGFESGKKSELIIGMPDGWSTLGEDEIITSFNQKYKEINPKSVMLKTTRELYHELTEGKMDVFFAMMTPEQVCHMSGYKDINIIELETLHLQIGLPCNHPAIHDGYVALEDLKDDTFIFKDSEDMRNKSDPKMYHFLNTCKSKGFEPKLRFVDARSQAGLSAVATGGGVMLLMFHPTMTYPGVSVFPVEGDPYQFKSVICYKKDNKSRALSLFIKYIRQMLK